MTNGKRVNQVGEVGQAQFVNMEVSDDQLLNGEGSFGVHRGGDLKSSPEVDYYHPTIDRQKSLKNF